MDKDAELEETLVLVGFLRQRSVNLRKELEVTKSELQQTKDERDSLLVEVSERGKGD